MPSARTLEIILVQLTTIMSLLLISTSGKKENFINLIDKILALKRVIKSFFSCSFCDRGVPGCLITLKQALQQCIGVNTCRKPYSGCVNEYIDGSIGVDGNLSVAELNEQMVSKQNLERFRKYYLDIINLLINKIQTKLSTLVPRLNYIELAARQIFEDPKYKYGSSYTRIKLLRRCLNSLVFWWDPQDNNKLKNGVFKPEEKPLYTYYFHCDQLEWTKVLLGMQEVQKDPFLVYVFENWSSRKRILNFWNPALNEDFKRRRVIS